MAGHPAEGTVKKVLPALILGIAAIVAAREAAEQFARDADADVGDLRRANQGVFELRARDQAMGITEAQQPVKTVRVVTTVDYYLR